MKQNAEQMEAHWLDFSEVWKTTYLPALMDTIPNLTPKKILNYKQGAWTSYLADTALENRKGK